MEGWIKLHRKLLEWEWYSDTNAKVLFLHCLLRANIKDCNWKGMPIKRGQFFSSYASLSTELGLSIKEIRSASKKLEKTGELTLIGASNGTMITVCNYASYQHEETTKGKPRASEGQAKGKRGATDREEEEEIEEEEMFNFKKSFLDLGVDKQILSDWLEVRKSKGSKNTKTAFESLLNKIKESGKTANECIKLSAEHSWAGFDIKWVKSDQHQHASNLVNPRQTPPR